MNEVNHFLYLHQLQINELLTGPSMNGKNKPHIRRKNNVLLLTDPILYECTGPGGGGKGRVCRFDHGLVGRIQCIARCERLRERANPIT